MTKIQRSKWFSSQPINTYGMRKKGLFICSPPLTSSINSKLTRKLSRKRLWYVKSMNTCLITSLSLLFYLSHIMESLQLEESTRLKTHNWLSIEPFINLTSKNLPGTLFAKFQNQESIRMLSFLDKVRNFTVWADKLTIRHKICTSLE